MGADNKATLEEIEAFLNEFKEKSKLFGIKYDIDKEENFRTLLELEMPGARRDEYIYNLKPEDYYQGPGINDYDPKEGMVRPTFVYHSTKPSLTWFSLINKNYDKSIYRR